MMRAVAQGIDRYFAEQSSRPLVTASTDDAG